MRDLLFSILIPTYNNAHVIGETIESVLKQSFANYEIIIQDDSSADNTKEVVKAYRNKKIKYFKNKRNLGYSSTLRNGIKHCRGDIIYLMGDDILLRDALLKTYKAFKISNEIGAVTRSYYWFDKDLKIPIRVTKQLKSNKDEIVKITDSFDKIETVFHTLGQLSGLAYRAKYIDCVFHEDCFTSHIYPFASIFKKHPIVFLKDFTIAVRIGQSQTRTISSIYDKSPLQSWVDLFNNVFYEKRFENFRRKFIKDYVATNYIGLVQIRNFARYQYFWREIGLLLKYRWQNVFSLPFWFFSLGTVLIPRKLLIRLVDNYKNKILSKNLENIKIKL
jgi:glycosyltransferase involved in cell wall biosynthesis